MKIHLPLLTRLYLLIWKRKAVFTWAQYERLLTLLNQEKYIVAPLNDFRDIHTSKRVVVGMRRDIDIDPIKALQMAQVEFANNIRATYFVLSTARYAGRITKGGLKRNNLDQLYHEIYSMNHEIGIHNDLLTVLIKYKLDPLKFTHYEILHFSKYLHIPIFGTSAHGCKVAKECNSDNAKVFSDYGIDRIVEYKGKSFPLGKNNLNEFGFQYEAYHLDHNCYISDAGGKLRINGKLVGFEQLICYLSTAQPGARIQLLIHPEWWGKK